MKQNDIQKVIAKTMYEVGNVGTWSKLSEKQKELWLLAAGYVLKDLSAGGFLK